MNRTLALPLAALALAACSPDFDPASKVEKLRVLAIRAEPPEIESPAEDADAPDRAVLSSLVLRPDFDAEAVRTTTVVHVACVPVPGSAESTACVRFEAFRDLGALAGQLAATACAPPAGDGETWPPVQFVGIETCGDAAADETCGPATVGGVALPSPQLVVTTAVGRKFGELPPGSPDRILGVQAVVLAFALEATPDELVAGSGTCPAADVAANLARLWPAREHVLAMKRVHVRGPDATAELDPPNLNPAVEDIQANGMPAGTAPIDGGTVYLDPVAAGTREPYRELDAYGRVIRERREEWVFSWFATAGEMEDLHTGEGETEEWKVDGGTSATVAVVVRDLRGGVKWAVRKVLVTP